MRYSLLQLISRQYPISTVHDQSPPNLYNTYPNSTPSLQHMSTMYHTYTAELQAVGHINTPFPISLYTSLQTFLIHYPIYTPHLITVSHLSYLVNIIFHLWVDKGRKDGILMGHGQRALSAIRTGQGQERWLLTLHGQKRSSYWRRVEVMVYWLDVGMSDGVLTGYVQ